jgi:hypothetical protein
MNDDESLSRASRRHPLDARSTARRDASLEPRERLARAMSDDEPLDADARTAWLRSKGVVIETREDREAARAAARRGDGAAIERDGPTRSFTYVKIPCDDDEALEERTLTIGEGQPGDALPAALRTAFAGGGEVDAGESESGGGASARCARDGDIERGDRAGDRGWVDGDVRVGAAERGERVARRVPVPGRGRNVEGIADQSKSGTIGAGVRIRWGELPRRYVHRSRANEARAHAKR